MERRVTNEEIDRAVELFYNNLFTSNETVRTLRKSGVLDTLLGRLLLQPVDDDVYRVTREILDDFMERRAAKR